MIDIETFSNINPYRLLSRINLENTRMDGSTRPNGVVVEKTKPCENIRMGVLKTN